MLDDGVKFLATLTKADGSTVHRETPNRLEFLLWVQDHYHPETGDQLVMSLEVREPAVRSFLVAMLDGLRHHRDLTGRRD